MLRRLADAALRRKCDRLKAQLADARRERDEAMQAHSVAGRLHVHAVGVGNALRERNAALVAEAERLRFAAEQDELRRTVHAEIVAALRDTLATFQAEANLAGAAARVETAKLTSGDPAR